MSAEILNFKPYVSNGKMGLSITCDQGVSLASLESFQQGYAAFLLGKSISSGRGVFNRQAFSEGWKMCEAASRLNSSPA